MTNDLSRREFMSSVGTMAAGALAVRPLEAPVGAVPSESDPLRDRAAKRGLLYGAATQRSILMGDPNFATAFAQQCGILVPENELKWAVVRPTPDSYNFAPADWLHAFAQQHQMKFRGHTLAWHEGLPTWFDSYATPQNARGLLVDHIASVVGHYAGRMHSWDVVNEVIAPTDKRPDGLRVKPWLELLGPEYIDIAFHAAAEADPKALLVWNEINLEFNWARANREALIQNLRDRLGRNVPIHAVGLQSHLWASASPYNNEGFKSFLRIIADMGLKILITEMDVTDSDLPSDAGTRDQIVAKTYYEYLSTVLPERSVIAVLTWGLSDRFTWLASFRPRKDGGPVRPLPLDSSLNPTPAWYAIARAFDEAAAR